MPVGCFAEIGRLSLRTSPVWTMQGRLREIDSELGFHLGLNRGLRDKTRKGLVDFLCGKDAISSTPPRCVVTVRWSGRPRRTLGELCELKTQLECVFRPVLSEIGLYHPRAVLSSVWGAIQGAVLFTFQGIRQKNPM